MKDAHERGAFDALYEKRRTEAEARREDLRAEGSAGTAKADKLEKESDRSKEGRKRAKEGAVALAQEEAELTERGATLLGRLGRGGSKVLDDNDDDGDEYGGLLDTDHYRKQKAALETLEAKEDKTPEDKKEIKRAQHALSMKRTRAKKKVEAEKAELRVEALRVRVAELGEELVAVLEEELRARAAA